MPRLHSCPLLHLHQLRPCLSPHCPGGPAAQEASSAWLFGVLHVPGPLYPRVHYREPQRGRDKGSEVHEMQPAAEQGLTVAQPGCLTLRHQERTSRDHAQLTRVPSCLPFQKGAGKSEHRVMLGVSLNREDSCSVGAWRAGRDGRAQGAPEPVLLQVCVEVTALGASLLPTQRRRTSPNPSAQQFTCQLPPCQVFAKTKTLKKTRSPGPRTQGPALPGPCVAWGSSSIPGSGRLCFLSL